MQLAAAVRHSSGTTHSALDETTSGSPAVTVTLRATLSVICVLVAPKSSVAGEGIRVRPTSPGKQPDNSDAAAAASAKTIMYP